MSRFFAYFFINEKSRSHAARASLVNRHLYNQGSRLEDETDWYNTPFRKYDASIGRFTGVDALAASQSSINGYHYGFNNPVNFSDPSGLLASGNGQKMYESRDNTGAGDSGPISGFSKFLRGRFGQSVFNGSHWSSQFMSANSNAMFMSGGNWRKMYGVNGMNSAQRSNFIASISSEPMYKVTDDKGVYFTANRDAILASYSGKGLKDGGYYKIELFGSQQNLGDLYLDLAGSALREAADYDAERRFVSMYYSERGNPEGQVADFNGKYSYSIFEGFDGLWDHVGGVSARSFRGRKRYAQGTYNKQAVFFYLATPEGSISNPDFMEFHSGDGADWMVNGPAIQFTTGGEANFYMIFDSEAARQSFYDINYNNRFYETFEQYKRIYNID